MRKIDLALLGVGAFLSMIISASAQDSVETVEALLKAENQAAAAKLAAVAQANNPIKVAVQPKAKPGPASIVVAGIYGVESSLRADIVYEGQTYKKVMIGGTVGPCVLASISGKSILLQKAGRGLGSDAGLAKNERVIGKPSKKAIAARDEAQRQCHFAEWTEPTTAFGSGSLKSPPGVFPGAGGMYPVPSLLSKPTSFSATQAILTLHAGTRVNGRKASDRTQEFTRQVVHETCRRLHRLGYYLESVGGLREKHLDAIVRDWHAQGLSNKTMQNQYSRLKIFLGWAGRSGIVSKRGFAGHLPNADPADLKVKTYTEKSKSWSGRGVDLVDAISRARIEDPRWGAMLLLGVAFGLRKKETCCHLTWPLLRMKATPIVMPCVEASTLAWRPLRGPQDRLLKRCIHLAIVQPRRGLEALTKEGTSSRYPNP